MAHSTRFQQLLRTLPATLIVAGGAVALPPGAPLVASPQPIDADRLLETVRASEMEPVARLLSDLGSDDLQSRERAMEALLTSEHCSERLLVRALRTFALLPEQRARLIECLRLRFIAGPQNAIGVQMQPVEEGIRVTRVYPQFPAAQKLLPNDVITAIDGVDISAESQLNERNRLMTCLILAHHPDELVTIDIIRDGERTRIRTQLGTRSDFGEDNPVDAQTLALAWQRRRASLGVEAVPGAAPIVAPVTSRGDWHRSRRQALRVSSGDGIAAGGEPHADTMVVPLQVAAGPAPRVDIRVREPVQIQGGARVIPVPADRNRDQPEFTGPEALAKMQAELNDIRVELARPNLQPQRRAELIETGRGLELQIRQLEGIRNIFQGAQGNRLREVIARESDTIRQIRDALQNRNDLTAIEREAFADALRAAEQRRQQAMQELAEAEGVEE